MVYETYDERLAILQASLVAAQALLAAAVGPEEIAGAQFAVDNAQALIDVLESQEVELRQNDNLHELRVALWELDDDAFANGQTSANYRQKILGMTVLDPTNTANLAYAQWIDAAHNVYLTNKAVIEGGTLVDVSAIVWPTKPGA